MPSSTPETFITAVEVQRPRTRLTPLRKTGTLRFEAGHLAFEGSDGRQRFRVPVGDVKDVVRHRSGFGFWLTFEGRRYYVAPRSRPRPAGFNPLYALVRPFSSFRRLWWSVRDRRRARALTRSWLEILTHTEPAVHGLPGLVRIPVRVALVSCVMAVVPALKLAMYMG